MRKKLKLLESLQEIDLRIDGRREAREKILQEMSGQDAKVEEVQAGIDEKQAEMAALREEKDALEEALSVESENIIRAETRLAEIKTQKEYQAVLKEIASAKKVKAELEEQILQKLGQVEELSAAVDEREGNLRLLAENTSARKSELQGEIDAMEKEMSEVVSERETTVSQLHPSVVNRYMMLREKRQGVAVVEARSGCCLGCNMNIPPQIYNNLFKGEELISCPHCQRMLFLRQEEGENDR